MSRTRNSTHNGEINYTLQKKYAVDEAIQKAAEKIAFELGRAYTIEDAKETEQAIKIKKQILLLLEITKKRTDYLNTKDEEVTVLEQIKHISETKNLSSRRHLQNRIITMHEAIISSISQSYKSFSQIANTLIHEDFKDHLVKIETLDPQKPIERKKLIEEWKKIENKFDHGSENLYKNFKGIQDSIPLREGMKKHIQQVIEHSFKQKFNNFFGEFETKNVNTVHKNFLVTNLYNDIIETKDYNETQLLYDIETILPTIQGLEKNKIVLPEWIQSIGDLSELLKEIGLGELEQIIKGTIENNESRDHEHSKFQQPEFILYNESNVNFYMNKIFTIVNFSDANNEISRSLQKHEIGAEKLITFKKRLFELLDHLASLVGILKTVEIIEEKELGKEDIRDLIEIIISELDLTNNLETFGYNNNKLKNLEKEKTWSIREYFSIILNDCAQQFKNQCEDYQKLLKERQQGQSIETQKGEKTNHYVVTLGEHQMINDLHEETTTPPPYIAGQEINEIQQKIANIMDDSSKNSILNLYPGMQNSLEGNFIILGPFGTGKTGLTRLLAHDKEIVTIMISASDIISTRVGVTAKNIKKIFELASQKQSETKKKVFILIDEMDILFPSEYEDGVMRNVKMEAQKELQMMLDGLKQYPDVHLIGLSNIPGGIPMDIYRRMSTTILKPLSADEKKKLIEKKLEQFPISGKLSEFLNFFSSIESTKSTSEQETFLLAATPKILSTICEKTYRNFIDRIPKSDQESIANTYSVQQNEKNTSITLKDLFANHEISIDDFFKAITSVQANELTTKEIEINEKFYKTIDTLLNQISGSFETKK